jgi:hypothetical protein
MKAYPFLLLLLAGCSTYSSVPWISNPDAFDHHRLSISGTLIDESALTSYSTFYLCPIGHFSEPNGACLDIIADKQLAIKLHGIPPGCVTVSGVFQSYSHLITTGYLRSDIGLIKARSVSTCSTH